MSDMAEYGYQQTNKLMQATMTTFLSFLKIWADMINDQISYAPYKKLAQWIREGGECKVYQVQAQEHELDEVIREMKRRIEKEQLGALRITDDGLLIVPEKDLEKIQEINRDILLEKCNYYQEVNLKEMENAVANLPPMFDKEMLVIRGITKYEAEVIKNKCNNIGKGFMVGISDPYNEGKCDLGVRADKVFIEDTNEKRHDFCKATLSAMVSLWGANHKVKVDEIDMDARIDNLIYNAANDDQVHYVAGSDQKSYIEISSEGFSKYSVREDNKGHFTGVLEKRISREDVNFYSELEIELDKVFDEKLFSSVAELNEYLVAKKKEQRDAINSPRSNNAKVQKNLVEEMDKMIKTRIINDDNYALLDTDAKYNCYMKEASNLLMAISMDEPAVPFGYTLEQINELKGKLHTITTDSRVHVYGDGTEPKEDKSVFTRVATKVNNLDVEKYKAQTLEAKEKERLRKERDYGNFNVENR